MAENFLNRLARNPYAPIDAASVSWIDEMGNGLDDWRNVIAPAPKQPAPQSWGDLGYGIATAPMRLGNALAQSISPYKGNEHPITQPDASSWQVPPLISESWDAINSFGNAYHNGMSEDDMRRNANIAAGLTMGGGGLAARPMEMLASNASKEASVPAIASGLKDRLTLERAEKDILSKPWAASGTGWWNISLDGNQIGKTYVREYPTTIQHGNFSIDPEFQRQGIGTEVQKELAQRYGKPTVPDGTLSEAAYQRWLKNDPAAVDGYEPWAFGAGQYRPKPGTPAYLPSMGAGPAPGTRASAGELFSNSDSRASLPALASGVGDRQGITAYHGSPHDFDRFDLSKIGTGEGAQAYGHGLYFAENEGVARSYRDRLGDYTGAVQWKGKQPPTPLQQRLMSMMGGADVRSGRAMTVDMLKREIGRMIVDAEHGMFPDAKRAAKYRSEYDELERIAPLIETKPPGHMYQVRINANPEYFLDWDKPFSEQPVKVQEAVANHPAFIPPLSYNPDNFMRNAMRDPETTALLKEAGLPGIRYLDKMSRDAGDGTSNYVVFDDSLIEILKKYGWVPPAAYGANALSQSQDNQY